MTGYDKFMDRVERYGWSKYGIDQTDRDLDPLRWYIYTGRASVTFLHNLCQCKPFMIARILHRNTCFEDAINAVYKYVMGAERWCA